ncbi:hypothetical protein HYFRA_00006485 [Hymenoscyphus fraxineus]|uniref:HD/PDEase domain-containing protein n=1 Tax=Hymenoscyphus fraxineus TaxID=746836 RepID=A0A9N9KT41_9HELO|nr:hypothetical protein HYFRA_00006485 [Hymenoscyphus fraxineus]
MSETLSPEASPVNTNKRPPGRPQSTPLEPYKDLIVRLFSTEDVPIIDIARKLNLEHGLDVSERTISRRLTQWNIPRKKQRGGPSQEIQDRIVYFYNKNYNDDQISAELASEGYEMKNRNIARLRAKLGLRRRSKFPEFREFSEEEGEEGGGESVAKKRKVSVKKGGNGKGGEKGHNAALIPKVSAFVEKYMSKYDGSHDFNHIRRVVGLAHKIYTDINTQKAQNVGDGNGEQELDLHVITLGALLHDVGDKKYLEPGQDSNTLVLATLLSFGAEEELAIKVQRIVSGVSYSSEIKDPAAVQGMIQRYPELAVVQDADRLDAIGAIGIGRTFTFGGAKNAKDMGETIQHFEDKLEKLEGMMKTAPGKRMARERTERLKVFKGWWEEERGDAEGLLRKK